MIRLCILLIISSLLFFSCGSNGDAEHASDVNVSSDSSVITPVTGNPTANPEDTLVTTDSLKSDTTTLF